MSWFGTAKTLFSAPRSPDAPRFTPERWQSAVGFSVNIPPEMLSQGAGDLGSPLPKVPRALAMQVPAVKRGRDLICSTLGGLAPRVIDSTNKTVPSELADQPEENFARSVTWTNVVEDMLFEKHGWLRITEFGADGYPSKVVRLEPTSVSVRKEGKVWVNSRTGAPQGSTWEYVEDSELIRIDSPNDGILTAGARAIRIALQLMATAGRYADDPGMFGFLTPKDGEDGPGDQKDQEAMLDTFEDRRRRRAVGYIEAMDFQLVSWSPEQLQLKDARDYAVLELARLFGVDPEEFGVSTTSRTYANSEQRRLDLIDFTLFAYVRAIEDRMRMKDVLPPGHRWIYDYTDFLRSDTLTRLQAYAEGLKIGVYTPERIAEIERIPVAWVKAALVKAEKAAAPPVPERPRSGGEGQPHKPPMAKETAMSARFSSTEDGLSFTFIGEGYEFKADKESRTVAGLALPWNKMARSGGRKWMFAPNSLTWSEMSRVKLDRDHIDGSEFGVAKALDSTDVGLRAKFGVAPGSEGDNMLGLAGAGVYDGFSVFVTFENAVFGPHPDDETIMYVSSGATLRKIALTALPAFDDARLTSVAATQKGVPMTAPTAPTVGPPAPVIQLDEAQFGGILANATAEALKLALPEAIKAAIELLPTPQAPERGVVKAGAGLQSVTEAPVYTMNGHGFSLVRDMWKSRTEGDHEATARLRKFSKQTQDVHDHMAANMVVDPATGRASFAVNTGNASSIIPPGYRPDLFVTQLLQERPLTNSVSRGTLTDATPFNIPKFVSSSGATATHVEGTNPTAGTLTLGIVTVAPTAISGTYQLTREIVDSANPAIDAIATQAMRESYSQQTEALVYSKLNGTDGVGGTITSGFVPSGAQVSTTSGQGDELLLGVRTATALYPFRRFGRANRAHISQEATTAFATAVDTTGRPLLAFVGSQNAVGTGNAQTNGYNIDGLTYEPTWSMTGNASTDADVIGFNSSDVWAWESGLLMFRFEERNGPANIDLALFGYFATQVLRGVGLFGIRHTAS
ncbi:MAG TPA: phage portal protein [Candidatus Deferrimicrobiaceae bacterium]|nr:phage portal protein [Candidatus Deferrimicrobiaceae bacterium]